MTDVELTNLLIGGSGVDRAEFWWLGAGAVLDRSGNAIVLVAQTTFESAAVGKELASRYAFLGEPIGIDGQGGVRLFRAPASVAGPGLTPRESPSAAGSEERTPLPRLVKVVFLARNDEGLSPGLRNRAVDDVLPVLIARSSRLRDMRAPLRTIASILEASGGGVELTYRDAASLDGPMAMLMGGGPPRQVPGHIARSERAAVTVVDRRAACLFRAPTLDVLTLSEGKIALLRQHDGEAVLRILDVFESRLWRAAGGFSRAEILRAAASDGVSPEVPGDTHLGDVLSALIDDELIADHPSWSVSDGAAWTTRGERSTVLDLKSGRSRLLALEGSAHWIWTILAGYYSVSEKELIRECARVFEVSRESIADDVVGLLDQLRLEGLLELA